MGSGDVTFPPAAPTCRGHLSTTTLEQMTGKEVTETGEMVV